MDGLYYTRSYATYILFFAVMLVRAFRHSCFIRHFIDWMIVYLFYIGILLDDCFTWMIVWHRHCSRSSRNTDIYCTCTADQMYVVKFHYKG